MQPVKNFAFLYTQCILNALIPSTETRKQDRGVKQRPNLQFLILNPRLDQVFRNRRGRLVFGVVVLHADSIRSAEQGCQGSGRKWRLDFSGGDAAGSLRWSQALALLQQLHVVIMAWMTTLRILLDIKKQEPVSPPMQSEHKSKRGNLPPQGPNWASEPLRRKLPTFSTANSTVNFTFSQYVSVQNPNRAVFTHYDSSLQLLYSGAQVGFMFIPAGKIRAGKTQYMAATFSVQSFPLSAAGQPLTVGPTVTDGLSGFRVGPELEIESRLEMAGRVRVLHFFTHHVEAKADCRVSVSVSDGTVMGFHC
nr:uncharacterized protein LOC105159219 [Ipomoea batatas]GMD96583.1 uncharacterized protein LOC105159219 [Ipomoea batatas]